MFIITAGEDKRLILHARTSRTYELICAVDDEDSLFAALKQFCRKFRTKLQMERYIQDYQSYTTRQGIIYKEYNKQLKQEWTNFFAPIYQTRIENFVAKVFRSVPGISFNLKRKRFRISKV